MAKPDKATSAVYASVLAFGVILTIGMLAAASLKFGQSMAAEVEAAFYADASKVSVQSVWLTFTAGDRASMAATLRDGHANTSATVPVVGMSISSSGR